MWFKKTKFGGVFEFNNNCLVQFYESFKNIKLLVPIFWGKKKSHNQGTIGGGGGIPFSKSPPPPHDTWRVPNGYHRKTTQKNVS